MFVFLSKFLPPFLFPLGLAIIFLIFSLLLNKRPRLRNAAVVLALTILLVASNRWVALGLARSLEWRYLPDGALPAVQAIVLLGGSTEPASPPRPMVEIGGAGDRVLYAAELYQQGKAPVILASGGYITWLDERASTPADEMAVLLQKLGVPKSAIWRQPKSQNTYEDALYSAEMLKEKGIQRVLLVTSAMHMPRSVGLFEKQGIEVIPAPADFAVTQDDWIELTQDDFPGFLVNILPNVSNLSLTTNALREYIGILAYRMRGWL